SSRRGARVGAPTRAPLRPGRRGGPARRTGASGPVRPAVARPRSCVRAAALVPAGGGPDESPARAARLARMSTGTGELWGTIARPVDHELVVKKSRFLAHLSPVATVAEADAVVA